MDLAKYTEAVRLLCGGAEPPAELMRGDPNDLSDAEYAALQEWCVNHATLPWFTGCGIIDTAAFMVGACAW